MPRAVVPVIVRLVAPAPDRGELELTLRGQPFGHDPDAGIDPQFVSDVVRFVAGVR